MARAPCGQIHDRMPVILAPNDHDPWLSAEADPDQLREVFEPFPAGVMVAHPVSKAVNNVKNDNESLLETVGDPLQLLSALLWTRLDS